MGQLLSFNWRMVCSIKQNHYRLLSDRLLSTYIISCSYMSRGSAKGISEVYRNLLKLSKKWKATKLDQHTLIKYNNSNRAVNYIGISYQFYDDFTSELNLRELNFQKFYVVGACLLFFHVPHTHKWLAFKASRQVYILNFSGAYLQSCWLYLPTLSPSPIMCQ